MISSKVSVQLFNGHFSFQQNPCQHPIIILRDVAYVDMSALLSFVYQGEVYVSQDRLTTFLRTAEMLHIKGLTEQNQQQSHIATHQLQRDQVKFHSFVFYFLLYTLYNVLGKYSWICISFFHFLSRILRLGYRLSIRYLIYP